MFEGGHDDTTCRARHALHIAEHERRCDGVRLAGTTSSDDDRDICPDELRETLGLVEIDKVPAFFLLLRGVPTLAIRWTNGTGSRVVF